MAAERRAWVLNLDADLELAAGEHARGYSPTDGVRAALAAFVPVVARSLLGPADVLVDEHTSPLSARGLVGRAFCPTPRALALLQRAGAAPEPAPPFEVLRRVNSRAFAAALGQTLPGAAFVTTEEDARRALAKPPLGDGWRVKRAFGMTGRGQRVVRGEPSAADEAFVRAALADGVQIEPNVALVEELAIHGFVTPDGRVLFGKVVTQQCDARGAWLATRPRAEGSRALESEAERVARALAEARYFGPFGVDAFHYRSSSGELALQPRSEINARYSMGYAIGMAR